MKKRSNKSDAPKVDHAANMPKWSELLVQAVNEPGTLSAAYSAFHNYSMGNMLLAYFQCKGRGIALGPIATFKGWQDKSRQVRKGEKAIVLCQPRTFTKKVEDDKTGEEKEQTRVFFDYKARWFVLAQTDGEDATVPTLPDWDFDRAISGLGMTRIPFAMADGNIQGYSQNQNIAINPVAVRPLKTGVHEMAHSMLHGKDGELSHDDAEMTRSLREVEAESVALLVLDALGQDGAEFSRGYIQHWLGSGNQIPEDSARRVMAAATKILNAGRPSIQTEDEPGE